MPLDHHKNEDFKNYPCRSFGDKFPLKTITINKKAMLRNNYLTFNSFQFPLIFVKICKMENSARLRILAFFLIHIKVLIDNVQFF